MGCMTWQRCGGQAGKKGKERGQSGCCLTTPSCSGYYIYTEDPKSHSLHKLYQRKRLGILGIHQL
jgi:hypothetical protein